MAKKKYQCPECGEKFDSEKGMKIHQSRSHGKKSSGKKEDKSNKGSKENVIHIKFNRNEAIQSKKDLLLAQRELLEILRHIKRYHLLRKKELTLKSKARKKLQEVNRDVSGLKKMLPKFKKPEILKEEKEEEKKKEQPEKIDHSNIDQELEEIQRKLQELENSTKISS